MIDECGCCEYTPEDVEAELLHLRAVKAAVEAVLRTPYPSAYGVTVVRVADVRDALSGAHPRDCRCTECGEAQDEAVLESNAEQGLPNGRAM